MLHKIGAPVPITTSPGFEGFADDILALGGSEDVVWTPADGEPVPLRAIVRERSQALSSYGNTTWHAVTSILVSAEHVMGILPGDGITMRGAAYEVAKGGVHPDGVAMVRIELSEVHR